MVVYVYITNLELRQYLVFFSSSSCFMSEGWIFEVPIKF